MNNPIWPALSLFAVTKSDSTVFTDVVRQLYVGTGGTVVVTDEQGNDITFKNVADGSTIGPFFIRKVKAATTAADIVAFV
jgi:hypothetical protein